MFYAEKECSHLRCWVGFGNNRSLIAFLSYIAWYGFQNQLQWNLVNLYVKEAQNASQTAGHDAIESDNLLLLPNPNPLATSVHQDTLLPEQEQATSSSPDVLWSHVKQWEWEREHSNGLMENCIMFPHICDKWDDKASRRAHKWVYIQKETARSTVQSYSRASLHIALVRYREIQLYATLLPSLSNTFLGNPPTIRHGFSITHHS